jgi:hypothetical protein
VSPPPSWLADFEQAFVCAQALCFPALFPVVRGLVGVTGVQPHVERCCACVWRQLRYDRRLMRIPVLRGTLCLLTWPYGETFLAELLLELITDARRGARRTQELVFAPGEEDQEFEDASPSASDDGPRLGKAYMRDMGVGEADAASVLDVWHPAPSEYRTFLSEGRDAFLRALFSCAVAQCVKHHSDTVAATRCDSR